MQPAKPVLTGWRWTFYFCFFLVVDWHKSWICQGKNELFQAMKYYRETPLSIRCLLNTDIWLGKILPFRLVEGFLKLFLQRGYKCSLTYFLLNWVALKACYGILCWPRFLFLLIITFPILVILWTTYFSIRSLLNYKNFRKVKSHRINFYFILF